MISLGNSLFSISSTVEFNYQLIPIYFVFLAFFSALSAPRAKYDAEANRQLLLSLLRLGPLTQKELIKHSKLSKSNVNYAINTLIRKGRVKKIKNISFDMRSVVYRVIEENGKG